MISIVQNARQKLPQQLERRSWYKKVEEIVQKVLPNWITMDIAVILLDDPAMREINRSYHNLDRVTDILSFFYSKGNGSANNEGELYICIPQIVRQAKRYGTTFLREYARVLVHGFLHLQGYDHMKTSERKRMNTFAAQVFLEGKRQGIW